MIARKGTVHHAAFSKGVKFSSQSKDSSCDNMQGRPSQSRSRHSIPEEEAAAYLLEENPSKSSTGRAARSGTPVGKSKSSFLQNNTVFPRYTNYALLVALCTSQYLPQCL
jgi:hypothetical protein